MDGGVEVTSLALKVMLPFTTFTFTPVTSISLKLRTSSLYVVARKVALECACYLTVTNSLSHLHKYCHRAVQFPVLEERSPNFRNPFERYSASQKVTQIHGAEIVVCPVMTAVGHPAA